MRFTAFWGMFSYLTALIIAVYLVAKRIVRRPHFVLRACLCCAVIFLYKNCFDLILAELEIAPLSRLFLRTMDSFVLYTLAALSVGICFECDFWAMLFCATSGYCMQHMSQRTCDAILTSFFPSYTPIAVSVVLLCFLTAALYASLNYFIIKKADYRGVMLDSRLQIMISFIAIAITIFLNSFALRSAEGNQNVQVFIMLFSALSAFLAFFVEFGWLAAKNAEIESSILQQVAEEARENYKIESDIIDIMNIKCHDLNHQIGTLSGLVSSEDIQSIQRTVSVYDSIFKTGNHALDVTLTRISLLCEKKGITLTCSVNGARLAFLSESDTYSLFSNLLMNAIEAVDPIDAPTKRIISLTTHDTPSAFVVHEENYMDASPKFENGLPQTTKADKLYHGFGTKSMHIVCKKYGGTCSMSASEGIFEVDIRFPHKD